jgi:hypothetical protein
VRPVEMEHGSIAVYLEVLEVLRVAAELPDQLL